LQWFLGEFQVAEIVVAGFLVIPALVLDRYGDQDYLMVICQKFFFLSLFIYSYVHTLFGSFLPFPSSPLPLPPIPLASRQNLFCPFLQFCWREDISNNKEDKAFLLVEIRIAI
jgi:hypothetical protein